MLVARIGRAGRLTERSDEDDPLADVGLAISASTGAILALLDGILGVPPLTAAPTVAIVAAHLLHRRRLGVVAAAVAWFRMLALAQGAGIVTPLVMLALCGTLLVGPGRVLDWAEACWEARVEWLRRERARREREARDAHRIDAVGWIEELPEPR